MTEKAQLDFIWNKIKTRAKELIVFYSFNAFIEPLEPVDIVGKKIVLKAQSELAAATIMKSNAEKLREAICGENFGLNDFKLIVDGSEEYSLEDDEETINDGYEEIRIDPKYTFDSFVVGTSNKFVFAAAKAVAENPGTSFNPLYVYGGPGLGKTHLLQAICNDIQSKKPSLKVLYTTCEKFLNEFIDNMFLKGGGRDRDARFRAHYRNVDVLIIDDIQFLAKKVAVQEAFFHTFNALKDNNKQIVISSDVPPKEIATLEERLVTRFEGGLIVDVQPPDLETKIAILKKKAFDKKYVLPDEVLEFLAKNSGNDVRTLEGRLNRVLFASKLHEQSINVELARLALNESVSEEKETVTADAVIDTTCSYFNIKKEDLLGKNKKAEIVKARQICTFLLCDMLTIPLITIGKTMGGRDHATVIYSRDKVAELIKQNTILAQQVEDIRSMILKQ